MKLKIKSVFFSLLGGILMGLCPAPFNAWYLAWVALIPLWLVIKQAKSLLEVILLAGVWGGGYYGLALFWITGVHPLTWMGVPWLASLIIALFCWLFITLWGTALVVVWSILIKLIDHKLGNKYFIYTAIIRVLIAVALWCLCETIWMHSPLWWSALGYTQSPNNLVILQLGRLSGANTVTAAIVGVNGLLTEAILAKNYLLTKPEKLLLKTLPILLLLICHTCGWCLYQLSREKDNLSPIKVGIIQGNVANEIKLYPAGWRKAIAGYTSGYQRLAKQGVDIVLTPETALPFYWKNIIDGSSSFYQAVLKEQVPAWVGAFGDNDDSYTNSLYTLTAEGKTFSRYDKYILVPLGEYIPFASILGKVINRLSPLEANLTPGQPGQIFPTPFGKAIVGICYESAFPQHFQRQAKKGGEFIITASNDAHYSIVMPTQHHALDIMRAIESDRWAARATNTGYSAIVDPRGHTLWLSDINQYAIHADTIYRRRTQTLYVRWGDWLTRLLLGLGAIGFLWLLSNNN